MNIYLIVLHTAAPTENRAFYERLGLSFSEKPHGDARTIYTCKLNNIVFELYPCAPEDAITQTRLGLDLSASPLTEDALAFVTHRALETHHLGGSTHYSVLSDPDGRSIEVVYQKPT